MIEYEITLFDLKDTTTSVRKGNNRWSFRMTHNPTGLFVTRSGEGQYAHQIGVRLEAQEELKQQVDNYYREQYGQ
jgi:hypothetical protein